MKSKFLLILLTSTVFISCSAKKMATNVIGDIGERGMIAIESEQDVEFAKQASLPLIKTLEVLRYGNPSDSTTLNLLSKAYGQYAFAFLEQDLLTYKEGSPEYEKAKLRMDLFYKRGKEYGIAAIISKHSYMKKAFKSHFKTFEKTLTKMSKSDVDILFWTAFNWANWLNLNKDDPTAIVNLPRIEAMAKRVVELDDNFYFGSAHTLIGTIAVSRPQMLGGNPSLSKEEFMKAEKIAPDYLMSKVLYAQHYARMQNDKNLFVQTLDSIEDLPIGDSPRMRLSNEIAKLRAKLLLNKTKQYF